VAGVAQLPHPQRQAATDDGRRLLMLNLTVGAVKILTGRLGPHYAHYIGSPELFTGAPDLSLGHTANSVVTWE